MFDFNGKKLKDGTLLLCKEWAGDYFTTGKLYEIMNEVVTANNGETFPSFYSQHEFFKVVKNKDKQKYKLKQFEKDINLFNARCGNKTATKDISLQETIDIVLPQAKVILEEVKELVAACENKDEMELKDGVVDILVTSLRLISLLKDRYDIMGDCQLVMENNHLKYTADYEKALEWRNAYEGEFVLSENTVNGVYYYCLKDGNGKIRKWPDFPKVVLSPLTQSQTQLPPHSNTIIAV